MRKLIRHLMLLLRLKQPIKNLLPTNLLTRKGNLVAPAGQHTVTVEKDASLPDGQYYIYMFNNNYGRVTAFPEFD